MQSLKDDIINRAKAKIQQELTAIENRDDLTQSQKISQIIHIFSAICAGVAVQPISYVVWPPAVTQKSDAQNKSRNSSCVKKA